MIAIRGVLRRLFNHRRLNDLQGVELDYRAAVGGHWDDVGSMQLEFLTREGLKPDHYLLDVGCGSFRGGRFFIDYLMEGHYFGIEKNAALLDAGKEHVLRPSGLLVKQPKTYTLELTASPTHLREVFGVRFDYVWVHALFDHIPPEIIRSCLRDLTDVMASEGRLYATIFMNPLGPEYLGPILRLRNGWLKGAVMTYPDRKYWHHTLEFFEDMVRENSGIRLEASLDDYPHPLGLRILRFIRV